jgi:hypothetical protein
MRLAYRANPSFFAVGQLLGVHHQTARLHMGQYPWRGILLEDPVQIV